MILKKLLLIIVTLSLLNVKIYILKHTYRFKRFISTNKKMVTKLYSAESFYVAQKSGKVARYMEDDKKLRKDNEGFYLNKSKSNGVTYKERVDNKDMVYGRSAEQGVTKYSKTLDYDKQSYGVKESVSKHNKHAHMSDLETSTGKVRRV